MLRPFLQRLPYVLLCTGLCSGVFSQMQLKGRVLSADNRQPVIAANVFLSNTSVGTITNDKGEFTINHFPAGRYDLVVSSLGYETVMRTVQSNAIPSSLEILLKPKVDELQEVIVEPYEKDGWDKWGKIFTDNFIGTSPFASDCRLLNPDVIKFRYSKKRNTVRASADERLVIENKALGYLIKYDLTKFEYDLGDRSFVYQGYPFFEEMQTVKPAVLDKWIANRQYAYYGSTMHFMRAVFNKKLAEEKFEVRKVIVLSAEEKERVEKLSKKIKANASILSSSLNPLAPSVERVTITDVSNGQVTTLKSNPAYADSLFYYKQVRDRAPGASITLQQLLPADSISFPIDETTVGLATENTLHVIYLPKKNLPEFQKYLPRFNVKAVVSSLLSPVKEKTVAILPNGNYFEGTNVIFTGFWAWWGKICNKLPYDYIPQ